MQEENKIVDREGEGIKLGEENGNEREKGGRGARADRWVTRT